MEAALRLVHLIYVSEATVEFTESDLLSLLAKVRVHNEASGVTGVLLHIDGSFLQVLEGDEDVVVPLFNRIMLDKRHTRISNLIIEPVTQRDFDAWTMGYGNATPAEISSVPGLNDFFTDGTCLLGVGEGRSKEILKAFRDGKWRRHF